MLWIDFPQNPQKLIKMQCKHIFINLRNFIYLHWDMLTPGSTFFTSKKLISIKGLYGNGFNFDKLATWQRKYPNFICRQNGIQTGQTNEAKSAAKICQDKINNSFLISASHNVCKIFWAWTRKMILQCFRDHWVLCRQAALTCWFLVLDAAAYTSYLLR